MSSNDDWYGPTSDIVNKVLRDPDVLDALVNFLLSS
jgi:hypothetical protein